VQRGIGQDRRPSRRIQPDQRSILAPEVNQYNGNGQLSEQGERPVNVSGYSAAFTGNG